MILARFPLFLSVSCTATFGHRLLSVTPVFNIISLCLMTTLTMFGRSRCDANPTSSPRSFLSMLLCRRSLAGRSWHSRLIMDASLTTLPFAPSSLHAALSCASPAPTLPSKTDVPNGSCAPSMTAHAPCSSMLGCRSRSGRTLSTRRHTSSTAVPALHVAMPLPSSYSLAPNPTTHISESLDANASLILPQLHRTNLHPDLSLVCSWAILTTPKDTGAMIQRHGAF